MKTLLSIILILSSLSTFASVESLKKAMAKKSTLFICHNLNQLIEDGRADELSNGGINIHNPEEAYQIVVKNIGNGTERVRIEVTNYVTDEPLYINHIKNSEDTDISLDYIDGNFYLSIFTYEDQEYLTSFFTIDNETFIDMYCVPQSYFATTR